MLKRHYPELDIPDFVELSKNSWWDPKLYQPMIYNDRVIKMSESVVPGTIAYDDFWDEMDYYCINGFKPKNPDGSESKMPRITGKHFYYLNFNRIELLKQNSRRKVLAPPFYRDLDHWLFLEIEAAQKHGYGLIIGKPRRVGLSEIGSLCANHEMTFFSRTKVAVAAGKEDKAQEFREKLESSLSNVHPAYKNGLGILTNNSEKFELGYYGRVNKQRKSLGLQSFARIKTMFSDESAFEGGQYSLAIFEEAGIFEKLVESYKATEPCFKEGAIQYGVPLVYGTGGVMDGGSKGYKYLKENAVIFNLKPVLVKANMYFPGDGIPDEKTGKSISFFNYETGVSNREAALDYIMKERKIAELAKETFIKHIQTYPMEWEEVFMQNKGGLLDLPKLNYQYSLIQRGLAPEPVIRGRLEWKDPPHIEHLLSRAKNLKEKTKIRVENEVSVRFVEDPDGNMWKDSEPINKNYLNSAYRPDVGGCDSYDEEADESNQLSAGAIMAYRTFINPLYEYDKPVGVLVDRGDGSFNDDVFYESAVMFAIYWDIEVLVEYSKILIIRYFYDVGAGEYIRHRPDIEEVGTGSHRNKDGIKMTTNVKRYGTKQLKHEVAENIHKCFFDVIILDLMKYGKENTDIAMAYMMCLYHKLDLFPEISEDIDIDYTSHQVDDISYTYYIDLNGNLRVQDQFSTDDIEHFIPERDLDKSEYEKYIKDKNKEENKILNLHKENSKRSSIEEDVIRMIKNKQKNFN